jgi:hypothetical protein
MQQIARFRDLSELEVCTVLYCTVIFFLPQQMSLFREGKALKTEVAQLSKDEDGSKEAREEGENME